MIVPITFEHEDKLYSGHFNSVSGAGSGIWHLMIDNYYKGELHYSGHNIQPPFISHSFCSGARFTRTEIRAKNVIIRRSPI